MRVLLDECVPHRLRQSLTGHSVATVAFMGWRGIKNGALLALMSANGFEVLLTLDQNLRYQQNLAAAGVAVVLLDVGSDRIADLLPHVPSVLAALTTIRPGDVVEITA